MSFRMSIETRGVKGAGPALKEFMAGIEKELAKVLPAYASDTVANMQREAPVDTGYMRYQIRSHFPSPTMLAINAFAPYSGFVNFGTFRMPPRPYFTSQVEQGPQILSKVFAQASMNYLSQVIKKYQNGP